MIQTKTIPNYKEVPSYLKDRIFGQDRIIDSLSDILFTSLAGFRDDYKPIASFIFAGSTGVGKTELAKELANFLDMNLIRIDMSEYGDEYATRNLIGSNKGLVGYEEGGILTNEVLDNPNSVLLLDEIEKADRTIFNIFLQVLDYGTLTDSKGVKVDFSKCIIIMTSNLGANENRGIGFGENENIHRDSAVKNFLSPEFRNRIDEIFEFENLSKELVSKIVDKYLKDFEKSLSDKNIVLKITNKAEMRLKSLAFDADMGARAAFRIIDKEFKTKIAKEYLFGSISSGGVVNIGLSGKKFSFRYSKKNLDDSKMRTFGSAKEAMKFMKEHNDIYITHAPFGNGYIAKKKKAS